MTTVSSTFDPWPLLRNDDLRCQRAIRLVVHGRSGGVVPESLIELQKSLQQRRQAPVQLEVLTADTPPVSPEQASWLVPLLLWPGSHARADVLEIRQRMQREGADVDLLPFLGSWQCWWALVAEALQPFASQSSVLVHHPLSSEEADSFLLELSERMGLPLLSFDDWSDYQKSHPEADPLMLALAPNRMTEALSEAGGLPPLLDLALIRQGLIDLLAALP
ncbi:DNA mismatch repair protein MutS [Synechococcus sp. MIT S9507]|uniref:DNA mismatch repair protein MutS n=1 Tax=Synechococcus sp. MIT S9507 TaxID=3082544 RepID=UPI0039B65A77